MVEIERQTSAISRSIRNGALWSGLNTLLMKLANILITAVVVRIVSPEDFGTFAVAATVFTIVSSFGELGLSSCIARRNWNPDVVAPTVATMALVSSAALAAGMAASAEPLATAMGAPGATRAIQILAVCVLLGGVFTVPTSLLVRDFRQGRIFAANMVAFIPANALLILLAINGSGAEAFAWSRLLGTAVVGTVVCASVKIYRPGINRAQILPVLRFGLPLAGANLLSYTLLNADYAFIGHQLGPALLGVYVLAYNVASWPTSVLSGTINSVAMPAFSRFLPASEELRQSLQRTLRMAGLIAFPICAVTIALADQIIQTLYGSKWTDSGPILAVLAAYGGIFVITLLFANMLVGVGKAGRLFIVQTIWLVTLVPAMWIGINVDGLKGAAVAHVVIIILVTLPCYSWALRKVVVNLIPTVIRGIWLPAGAALGAGVSAWLAGNTQTTPVWGLLVGGSAGGIVYLIIAGPALRLYLPFEISLPHRTLARRYRSGQGKHRLVDRENIYE